MRIRITESESPRAGVAMVLAVVVLGTLLTITYAFSSLALGNHKRTGGAFDDRRAFLLADSALNESFEALRGGGTGAIASQANPAYLGGGVFWVEAQDLGNDETLLTATALIGSGRSALASVVSYDDSEAPLFQTTLNSRDQLTLNSAVVIDSFDSSVGTYVSQAVNTHNGHSYANDGGDARSNADIVLNADAHIFGDAIPGPGHTVFDGATGTYISGSKVPAPDPFLFPPLTPPVIVPTGPYAVANGGSATLSAGTHAFTNFTINKDATLTIEGPAEILVDDFTGGKDANLIIDATLGPVTFHVQNSYTHISGFEADSAMGSPMALAFMIGGATNVVFPSGTNVRGAYYAPDVDIVFSGSNECWGAFAANRIDMSNSMRFHFDEDLMNHWDEDTGQGNDGFDLLAWGETDFEPDSLLIDRRDPLAILGFTKAQLSKPADLWEMAP